MTIGLPFSLPAQVTSPVDNLYSNGKDIDPYVMIMNHLQQVRRQSSKNPQQEEFMGLVLYSIVEPIEKSQFVGTFPEDSKFYKEVLKNKSKAAKASTGGSIISCYCFVPELSGYLPFPDVNILKQYNDLMDKKTLLLSGANTGHDDNSEAEENASTVQAALKKIYPKIWKEWAKIVHFPLFHSYSESESTPSQFNYVKVKLSTSLDSCMEGVLSEVLNEVWVPESEQVMSAALLNPYQA